jgi:hypothetical protein
LLLGASDLGDLERVDAHCLAQGPALAHSAADLDVPEAGDKCTNMFLWHFSKQLYLWI